MQIQKTSIVYKLTLFVICMIIAQAVLLTGLMVAGGVLQQAEDNAYQAFYEKVKNRNSYIQREMKYRWSNINPFVNEISGKLGDTSATEDVFKLIMPDLLDLLRTSQATGSFVILNNPNSDGALPSLYLRDYDPLMNEYSNDDLYMLFGPSELANANGIPLDENWHSHLSKYQSQLDFYQKPYSSVQLTQNAELLGYWSTPFTLYPEDPSIITYSMPLFDPLDRFIGIIGVEVSIQNLTQNMPASDLTPKDSLGYLIAFRNNQEDSLLPIISHGALQKRMIHEYEALSLTLKDRDDDLYILNNHNSKETIFACVQQIGLSYPNTPFEQEQWYLVGLMTENKLLSYVNQIRNILLISLLLSVLIGMAGGIFISYRFSKPILKLAREVKESERVKHINLSSTGLLEVDQLSLAMSAATNALIESTTRMSRIIELVDEPIAAFELRKDSNRLFATDQIWKILSLSESEILHSDNPKAAFESVIEKLCQFPESDETHIYKLPNVADKWIKLKTFEMNEGLLGVVTDVTREIIDKKEIMQDRDTDPLTGLLNRKAFHSKFDVWANEKQTGISALLMFDLDNLKSVNDTYGHRWGDIYIKLCVKALQTMTEPSQMILGRRSGDEFVMLIHDLPSQESIRRMIASFYKKLETDHIIFPDHSTRPLTISSGLVWIDSNLNVDYGYDTLLQKSDEALYDSKRNSKGKCTEAK